MCRSEVAANVFGEKRSLSWNPPSRNSLTNMQHLSLGQWSPPILLSQYNKNVGESGDKFVV